MNNMRIGIDVDDTITNSWEALRPHYSRLFKVDEDILKQSKPYYSSVKDKLGSIDEYFEKIVPIYDEVIPQVELKDNVKEVIDKLSQDGHDIIFITARGRGHTDPYKQTKDYLDRHKIKYDKIIVNAANKANVCQSEKIDLFIDDSTRNCQATSDLGIETLLFETNYNKDNDTLNHVKSWLDIYNYIKGRWENGR